MKPILPILLIVISILTTCSSSQNLVNESTSEQASNVTNENVVENPQILFYRSKPSGADGNLFSMDENGENQKQIGQSGSRPDHYPNWSPDGKSIVFESYRQGGWRIWIMNSDGKNARRLLSGRSGTGSYEFDPSFTSDGKSVLFMSGGDIFQVDVDGTNLTQITKTPDTFEFSPHQSPDGKTIVFCAGGANEFGIFTVDSDGSNRKDISKHSSINYAPTWSPDGSKIAFYSDRNGSFEIYLMDSDGKNQMSLLNSRQIENASFEKTKFIHAFDNDWGSMTQYKASFSPGGSRIAFSRNADGNREIFIVDTTGENLKRLTNNKLHDGFPMWTKKNQLANAY